MARVTHHSFSKAWTTLKLSVVNTRRAVVVLAPAVSDCCMQSFRCVVLADRVLLWTGDLLTCLRGKSTVDLMGCSINATSHFAAMYEQKELFQVHWRRYIVKL